MLEETEKQIIHELKVIVVISGKDNVCSPYILNTCQ